MRKSLQACDLQRKKHSELLKGKRLENDWMGGGLA